MDLTDASTYGTIGSDISLEDIKSHWWMQIRPVVLQQLQGLFNQGWELVTSIGPDCLNVDTRDRVGFFGTSIDVYPIDVRIQLRRRLSD
jgi:hypothetical protein